MEPIPEQAHLEPGLSFDKVSRLAGETAVATIFEVYGVHRWVGSEQPRMDAGTMHGVTSSEPALAWRATAPRGVAGIHIGDRLTVLDLANCGVVDSSFALSSITE
jgi:hypothetical protein